MKIVTLVRSELQRLTSTGLARLALVALMTVPLLYGGLYLWANQDPYAKLDQVPAALVNADAGSEVDGAAVNYGDDVENEVLDGGDFDWHQATAEEARAGLEDGTYDFTFTIPTDFSADLASASGDDPQRAQIVLATNDTNSYLSTTIAEQAAKTIRASVTERVGKEAATQLLVGLSDIRTNLGDAADGAAQLNDGLGTSVGGADQLVAGAEDAESGADRLASGASDAKAGADRLAAGAASAATGAHTLADGTASSARAPPPSTRDSSSCARAPPICRSRRRPSPTAPRRSRRATTSSRRPSRAWPPTARPPPTPCPPRRSRPGPTSPRPWPRRATTPTRSRRSRRPSRRSPTTSPPASRTRTRSCRR
nr:hypothetical protein GCM10025699_74550 [Microbacterium flavescens]